MYLNIANTLGTSTDFLSTGSYYNWTNFEGQIIICKVTFWASFCNTCFHTKQSWGILMFLQFVWSAEIHFRQLLMHYTRLFWDQFFALVECSITSVGTAEITWPYNASLERETHIANYNHWTDKMLKQVWLYRTSVEVYFLLC